jgi:hypothetical protein
MTDTTDPWGPKSFDFAQDLTKQLMTLDTALIALTITFVKDFASTAPDGARVVLAVSWLFYLLSLVFGIFGLMALTGVIAQASDGRPASVFGTSPRLGTGLMVFCFLLGLVTTVAAGIWALV